MIVKFISWDWRGGPDPAQLVKTINSFLHGPIYAVLVATGDADPTLALSDEPLGEAAAYEAWSRD